MGLASKNIIWLTLSRVAALVMLFFAYTQLFRYLGPHGTGEQQFILSYVTIFGIIIDFGIQQYIIKKISEDPDNTKKYFQNFFAVEVLLSIFIYSAMVGAAWFLGFPKVIFYGVVVAGFGLALNGLSSPFLAVMSAFQNLRKVALLNFLSSFINMAFIFTTIAFHKYVVFLMGNQVVYGFISLALYYVFVKDHIKKPELLKAISYLDFTLVKRIFRAALPFAMLVGFSTIYNRIDVLLITQMRGFTETGLYTAAYKFFDLVNFFPAVVSHALYPVFTGFLARNEYSQAKLVFEKYLRLMIFIALPMGVGGSILAPQIMRIIAGQQFNESSVVLAVLVWAPVALFIYIVANAIVISQLTKFAVAITGTNVIVNVVGNLILLPRIGVVGAAIMTVVSETIQGFFYFYFVRKKIIKFSFLHFSWQPVLASAVMGVCVWYFRNQFIVTPILVGSVVYLVILGVLGFIKKDDLKFIKSIFRKEVTV